MIRTAWALHRVDLQRTARVVGGAMAANAAAAAPAAPAGFVFAGSLADIPTGLSELQLRPDAPLVLVRRDAREAGGAPTVSALGGLCAHKGGRMALGDIEDGGSGGGGACSIVCPRHRKRFEGGLRFDVETGAAFLAQGAAAADEFDAAWRLPVHEVRVLNGAVYVAAAPREPGGGAAAGACAGAGAAEGAAGTGAGAGAGGRE